MPSIERLCFGDGTPFADNTTLEWIARHAVVRDLEAGENVAALLVSAGGEADQTGDWPQIETGTRAQRARWPGGCFAWLEALPGIALLQRLVMARIAAAAGRDDTALALLTELDAAARSVPLIRWEPALIFDVKQQLLLALKAMSTRKDADKSALTNRVGELRGELTVLDPAHALSLQ